MAIQYKKTKQIKEKPEKIKKEKPVKVKQEKSVKIKKDNSLKIKKEKPAKIEKAPKAAKSDTPKIKISKSDKQPKEKGGVKLSGSKSTKKINAKKVVVPLIIVLVLALVAALVFVIVNAKKVYDNQIARVLVSTSPDKVQYYVGDAPKYDGLTLQVVLNSGKSYYVDETECEFSGFDSSKAVDRQTITVSYKGYLCSYKIMIKDAPTPAKVLSNIYLETEPKTEYKVNEWLDTAGGVLMIEYTDGTYMRHNLTVQDVYCFVTDVKNETYVTQQVGTYTLEIRYREGGVTKTCTYEITVTE